MRLKGAELFGRGNVTVCFGIKGNYVKIPAAGAIGTDMGIHEETLRRTCLMQGYAGRKGMDDPMHETDTKMHEPCVLCENMHGFRHTAREKTGD